MCLRHRNLFFVQKHHRKCAHLATGDFHESTVKDDVCGAEILQKARCNHPPLLHLTRTTVNIQIMDALG